MKRNEKSETTGSGIPAAVKGKSVPRELEDEIYEKRLLARLECLEKLNRGRNEKSIFLVHDNNGMVSHFRELALLLEKRFNVYGIQARGFKPGTKVPDTPDKLVNDYLEQILVFKKSGPYILGGFCSGIPIAYEIGRRLEKRNLAVEKLVLLDPHVFITDEIYKLIRRIRHLPGFVEKWLVYDAGKGFQKEMRANNYILTDSDDDALRKEKIEKYMDTLLRHLFYFGIIKAPLLVTQPVESPRPTATQERFDRMTKSRADLIEVPGDHYSMLKHPHVKKLAEVILNNL